MENQKKIAPFLLYLFLAVCCTNNNNLKNETLGTSEEKPLAAIEKYVGIIENVDQQQIFQIRTIHSSNANVDGYYTIIDGVARFKRLINLFGDTLSVQETLDSASFKVVGIDPSEKRKIRNPYFFDGRMNCYYSDKENLYAFLDRDSIDFVLLGKKKETELLGGAFVRVKDKIFLRGIEVDSADVVTFHTMEVFWSLKTEWNRTIGLDKNYIYISEKPLTKESFDKLIAPNDSLRSIYFPNNTEVKKDT